MAKAITYKDALQKTKGKDRVILLGNGFSIAQGGRFSYSNLIEKSNLSKTDPVRRVFDVFKTVDFESVLYALEYASKVEGAYGSSRREKKFHDEAIRVREALITAIQQVHPAIQYDIPVNEMKMCGDFLSKFQKVFTLNYDLLVYWVNLNTAPRPHNDGFGLGDQTNGFRTFDTAGNCSLYNLHGGLHLFRGKKGTTLKKISSGSRIVADIESSIRKGRMPLFVAEGTSTQKLTKINAVPYLRHCYDQLYKQAAPLFIFGHSADAKDEHIYEAIFEGKTPEIYFCVHEPQKNLKDIRKRLAKFEVSSPKKELYFIDSSKVSIWR